MDDEDGIGGREPGTHPGGSRAAQEAVRAALRYWWISVLRGGLALLLGIGALISGASQQLLVNYIALYWLLGGLLTTRWALGVRWRAGSRLGLVAGLLAIAMGLVLMARHRLEGIVSLDALIGAVAVTTVATGCLRMVGAFEVEERTGHRWTFGGMILGSVEVVLGVILILVRSTQASTVRLTIGIWGCGLPAPRAGGSDAASASCHRLTLRAENCLPPLTCEFDAHRHVLARPVRPDAQQEPARTPHAEIASMRSSGSNPAASPSSALGSWADESQASTK